MQEREVILPFEDRPALKLNPENQFDRFAAPGGRVTGLVIKTKSFGLSLEMNDIAYVNLWKNQGIHPGHNVRIYQSTGRDEEIVYQAWRYAFRVEGFVNAGLQYDWKNMARQVVGEGGGAGDDAG
jgi:hypothetical protein